MLSAIVSQILGCVRGNGVYQDVGTAATGYMPRPMSPYVAAGTPPRSYSRVGPGPDCEFGAAGYGGYSGMAPAYAPTDSAEYVSRDLRRSVDVAYMGRRGECWKGMIAGAVVLLLAGAAFVFLDMPTAFTQRQDASSQPPQQIHRQVIVVSEGAPSQPAATAPSTAPQSSADAAPGAMESFDCEEDSAAQRMWLPEKRRFCCLAFSRGCRPGEGEAGGDAAPGDEAAAGAGLVGQQPRYDCASSAGFQSDEQRTWCCKNFGKGCPTEAPSTTTAGALFDCKLGDVVNWPSSKQTWCCQEQGVGCEQACSIMCSAGGQNATCAARILQAAGEKFKGSSGACVEAYGATMEECPGCSACRLSDVGCKAPSAAEVVPKTTAEAEAAATGAVVEPVAEELAAPTTAAPVAKELAAPTTAVPVAKAHRLFDCHADSAMGQDQWSADKASWCCKHEKVGCPSAQTTQEPRLPGKACDSECLYLGHTATCRERMVYSVANNYGGREEECGTAYSVMVSHCPVCASCPMEDVGCNATATPAETAKTAETAATTETAYGAEADDTAAAPAASAGRFHCQEDPQYGVKGWSETKRKWCCRHAKVGCSSSKAAEQKDDSEVPRKCDALCTFSGHTASCKTRVQYAISHGFVGRSDACPAAHNAVLKNCSACSECTLEEAGCPSSSAASDSLGASSSTLAPSDSEPSAAPASLGARSSTEAPSGSEPYDCQENAAHWLTNWTNGKKDWCCRNLNVGCLPNVVSQEKADAQPTASKLDGCEALCTFEGHTASCRARVEYARSHRFKGAPHECSDAHEKVLQHCPSCSGCALVDMGCSLSS